MKKKTVIFLSCVIVVMLGIITAEVIALYHGVNDPNIRLTCSDKEPVAAAAEPKAAEPKAETPKAEPVAKVEPKAAEPKAAEPKADPKPRTPKTIELTVTNCATGKKNTLVQNPDNYALSLVDHTRKTLWTVPMDGPITEAVGEVDYFNNKKIQFLVACGSKLHLLDRLGHEVKSFPRTLPAAVVDGPYAVNLKTGGRYWRMETTDGIIFYQLRTGKILKDLN